MSARLSHTLCTRPRYAVRAVHHLASCGLLLALVGTTSLSAQQLTVKLASLECLEETNEVGADEPYLLTYAVNFRTGETHVGFGFFRDVDAGEIHVQSTDENFVWQTSILAGSWAEVQDPNDVIVVALLAESDASSIFGFFPSNVLVPHWLREKSVPFVQSKIPAYRNHQISRDEMVQLLKHELIRGFTEPSYEDEDELIDTVELRLTPEMVADQRPDRFQRVVAANGDGGRYRLHFDLETTGNFRQTGQIGSKSMGANSTTNNGLAFKEMLRIRVRDSLSKQPLAARVQLIADGKIVVERRATADGKFEEAVLPGDYRVRFTMKEPSVSHHTLIKDVTVGKNGTYRDIYLEPLLKTVPIGPIAPQINLAGTWHATLFGQQITYEIKQKGNSFEWSLPQLQEAATGTILSATGVAATLHGPHAPTPPVIEGTVKRDAGGKAVEIAWNNGVKFVRGGASGNTPPPAQTINLAGTWRANLAGQWISYTVTQHNNKVGWIATQLGEEATGSISGKTVSVTYYNPTGSNQLSGTVKTDASGKAVEIAWNNGVRFVRGGFGGTPPPPPPSNLTGTWRANLGGQTIVYQIQHNGSGFSWNAPQLSETATGSVSGNNVSASYSNPFSSGGTTVSGTIHTNGNGMPVRITWQNGVTFFRDL